MIKANTSNVDEKREDISVGTENREHTYVVDEKGMMETSPIIDSTFANQILTCLLPPKLKSKKQTKREKAAEVPEWVGLTLNLYKRIMQVNFPRSR